MKTTCNLFISVLFSLAILGCDSEEVGNKNYKIEVSDRSTLTRSDGGEVIEKIKSLDFEMDFYPIVITFRVVDSSINHRLQKWLVFGSLNTLLNMPGNSETNFANLEEIQIWNTTNMVRYLTNIQTPIQISMYGLPNGVYTIRVIKDGKSYSKKFFKS